jgi:hypothetical protein
MEANEAHELQEHAEHGSHDASMRPVALTMTILAVLVAITTVIGHRAHTEAILDQAQASDTWNEYQAKKIRSNETTMFTDLLAVVTITDGKAAHKIAQSYADHQDKWKDDLKQLSEKAESLEKKKEQAEDRGLRFDLGEALLEIGLVITSVTLLTRSRVYWFVGLCFSLGGILSALSVLLLK